MDSVNEAEEKTGIAISLSVCFPCLLSIVFLVQSVFCKGERKDKNEREGDGEETDGRRIDTK